MTKIINMLSRCERKIKFKKRNKRGNVGTKVTVRNFRETVFVIEKQ